MRIHEKLGYVRLGGLGKVFYVQWSNYSPLYYTGTMDGWGFECTTFGTQEYTAMVF